MLGDMVYEGRGKVIGTRILPNGKIEQTVAMQGTLLGEEFSTIWTNEAEVRPDGTVYIEFRGFTTTKGGATGPYKGSGNGIMRHDGSGSYRGVLCSSNPPGKYAKFNGIALVFEAEADKDGNLHNKGWEWK